MYFNYNLLYCLYIYMYMYSKNSSKNLFPFNSKILLYIVDGSLSYPELGPHLVNPDHIPSKHNPDHAQGPKWAPVMVDRPTHWAPSTSAHHPRNTWYLILELTRIQADYCMTHSCNYTQLEVRPIKIISSLANTP